ncbi:MAG TPA: hypothetical protein VF069_01495 [Streptosporangiaceae bacterium]
MPDRTRRLLPAVLVSLIVSLGLCGASSAPAAPAARAATSASTVTTAGSAASATAPAGHVAHVADHDVARAAGTGAPSRMSGQRLAGGPGPLTVAALLAALSGLGPLTRRWPARRGAVAGPAPRGRLAHGSRAPPGVGPLPA